MMSMKKKYLWKKKVQSFFIWVLEISPPGSSFDRHFCDVVGAVREKSHGAWARGGAGGGFWDNMRRYGLYALTVSTGAIYTILQPAVELLKKSHLCYRYSHHHGRYSLPPIASAQRHNRRHRVCLRPCLLNAHQFHKMNPVILPCLSSNRNQAPFCCREMEFRAVNHTRSMLQQS